MDNLIQFAYVVSAALFIFGLKQLGSPATARRDRRFGSDLGSRLQFGEWI